MRTIKESWQGYWENRPDNGKRIVLSDMDGELIDDALERAIKAHRGQVRKYTGEDYVEHCICVREMVAEHGGSVAQQMAALLHDTIEDTDVTYEDLVDEFGQTVAGLVRELTDQYTKEDYPALNRRKRKDLEIERLAKISNEAKLIKWCDLADNTSSIIRHDPGFAKTYLIEKAKTLEAMGF